MDRTHILTIGRDIFFFLSANVLGFFSGPFAYNLGIVLDIVSLETIEANPMGAQEFFTGTITVCFICIFLSAGFFILQSHNKWRWAFLLFPIFGPLFYGLAVLNTLSVIP